MPTIEISGVTYEVYGDQVAANSYFKAASHGAPWLAATSALRNQALVTQTRVFERESWQGLPTLPVDKTQPQPAGTQPLEWGRTGLFDRNGVAVDPNSIPADIVSGAFEYALELISTPTVQTEDVRGSNLKVDKKLDRVEGAVTVSTDQQFFIPTIGALAPYPNIVFEYIGQWLGSSGAGVERSFVSGTTATTPLDPPSGDFTFTGDGLP